MLETIDQLNRASRRLGQSLRYVYLLPFGFNVSRYGLLIRLPFLTIQPPGFTITVGDKWFEFEFLTQGGFEGTGNLLPFEFTFGPDSISFE